MNPTATAVALDELTAAIRAGLAKGPKAVKIDAGIHDALVNAEQVHLAERLPLVEAFHTLWDLKDEANARGDDEARLAAYEALNALRVVFEVEGVEMPRRFDGSPR